MGNRIKTLRKEKGWSQDEFAYHAQIDGRQVSRYENDRVTPSIEAAIKMAKAFNVSLDYLLLEEAPRRPLQTPSTKLAERVLTLEGLSEEDEKTLLYLIDAIATKNKVKALAGTLE